MKIFIKNSRLILAILPLLILAACKKDEVKTFSSTPVSVANFSSSVTYPQVLALATKTNTATTFTWDKAMYGNDVAPNYTLQYDSAGKGFVNAKEIPVGTGLKYTLTQEQLNGLGLGSGIPVNQSGTVEFRVKSTTGTQNVQPSYSSVVNLTFTTYDAIVFWYMPGDYQGWSPSSAPKLGSVDLENYVGYAYVPSGGSYEFKITTEPDWNHTNYGSGGPGKLDPSGGNLSWPAPHTNSASGTVYYVTTKKSDLSWTTTPQKFTIAGDFNSWNSSANELTYNTNNIYTFTTNFAAGGFKIVINGSTWCGSDGSGALKIGSGDNIPITAGTHTVKVDMSFPTRYKVIIE